MEVNINAVMYVLFPRCKIGFLLVGRQYIVRVEWK